MNFKKGDKVICIDLSGASGQHLRKNQVYTIKEYYDGNDLLVNLEGNWSGNNGFRVDRFKIAKEYNIKQLLDRIDETSH